MHCESAATFRPRDSGGGGPLELAKRANRGGGGAGRGASLSVQKILCAGRSERAKMSGDHQNSCVALSPAPPPPPCFAGWSPSPAIAGADEEWRMKLAFADLFEDFFGVLAEPRRRAVRGHRCAVEHDGRADAGAGAAFGGGVLQIKAHAAMDDLRIGEDLLQIVDGPRGNAGGFELVQYFFALHPGGERAQLADQLGTVRKPAFVVLV